jgi:hypothetical protein
MRSSAHPAQRRLTYFFFLLGLGFAALLTCTVAILTTLPPDLTVNTAVSLRNRATSARPVALSESVTVFFVPAASDALALATVTCFVF